MTTGVTTYCCDRMRDQVEYRCETCVDQFECPDNLVYRSSTGEFGLIVHDGGTSFVVIAFCPWCGAALPRAPGH